MARVFPEILCTVNNVSLASKIVNSVRYTLCVDVFLGAGAEILFLCHAQRVLNTGLEHFTGLLTEDGMLFMVRLKILFPSTLQERSHYC